MGKQDLIKTLEDSIKRIEHIGSSLKRKNYLFAWIRFILFIGCVYSVYLFLYNHAPGYLWFTLSGIILLGFILNYHSQLNSSLKIVNAKAAILREEIDRIELKFPSNRFGTQYQDPNHHFSFDLDLFGKNSLFHQVDRTEIPSAEQWLARHLTTPLNLQAATDHQKSIKILSSEDEWCFNWSALLRVYRPQQNTDKPIIDFPTQPKLWLNVLSFLFGLISISLFIVWAVSDLPFTIVLGVLPFDFMLLAYYQKTLFKSDSDLLTLSRQINQYLYGFQHIKNLNPGSSTQLQVIKQEITQQSIKAWSQLNQIIYFIDSRSNFLYWLFNPFFFFDTWIVNGLFRWGQQHGQLLPKWMNLLEEMDTLVSMAGYTRLHPNHLFPELVTQQGYFEANELGQPLIPETNRIHNSFCFNKEKLVILTGSNMSGKSTFLRTVGIAHLMAWVGLPVPASTLKCGEAILFTSMRTTDDLNQNTSSFYAELKRIKQLLMLIETEKTTPIFFFLDEILKGTNSVDRHQGAVGLVEQLIQTTARGFISTHDLDLAYHFNDHQLIRNDSFNSQLKDNQLIFDYLLTPGICQSSNASALMRQMGIIA